MPRENVTQPAWTPDGRRLIVRAPYPDSDIWRIDRDGSNRRLLFHLPGEQLYPSYSPDMTKIAYTSPVVGRDRALFVVDADGSNPTKVFDTPGKYDSAPNWSPDGRRIAFESDRDGDMEVYAIDADGSNLEQLTRNAIHDEGPVWSRDGRRTTFTSGPADLEGDVHVMESGGSRRVRLTFTPGRDESPDWQPIPHEGDLTACGDVVAAGPGASSVKAAGDGLAYRKAREVAERWSAAELARDREAAVEGFECMPADAGYGALAVTCSHRGATPNGGGRGSDRSVVFVRRG